MRKLLAILMLTAAIAAPAHALEVGDTVKFLPDQQVPACVSLEDAKRVPWDGDFYQMKAFLDLSSKAYVAAWETLAAAAKRSPDEYVALVRQSHLCQPLQGVHLGGGGSGPFRISQKADGYICVDEYGSSGKRLSTLCMWTREPKVQP